VLNAATDDLFNLIDELMISRQLTSLHGLAD